ncbi:MAG: MarR family winged helix-turn-helix transcriptional regulator [Actinomycetes bacterium]
MMNDDIELQELASGFRDALRHSVYLVRRLDADGDLSAAQLNTLKMLLGEGQRVGEIARNLGVRVPSATEQIIKLERAGLARREPDPADSRAVRVILTPEGRAAVDSADRHRNRVMAGILSTLNEQDRAALAQALPVLGKINASLQN